MRQRESLLEVDGLDAAYGRAQVLFGVSLSLAAGETVALIGSNGAGKSTTLKAIMGLLPARARSLRFAGHDIQRLATYRIARLGLGYVPEDRRIFTELTVFENLEVGARTRAGAETEARTGARTGTRTGTRTGARQIEARQRWTPDRLFSIFPNLAEMAGRKASQMSGGEQQMLAIARTLMGNPDAILLDEPTEGLAPVIVDQMAEAVQRMKAEGIAVLLSEQNLNFAAAVADRAYLIAKGAVRQEGRMADLAANPAWREAHLGL
jgi:branched-chain amino acid transport system ATP-binding protein